MNDAWKQYAGDFNAMSDEEIEAERQSAQDTVDEQMDWIEAVASWEAAGKPRDGGLAAVDDGLGNDWFGDQDRAKAKATTNE